MQYYYPSFMSEVRYFKDRKDAGQQLAQQLSQYKGQQPIVLALPRGGVVVGYEVAKALQAPFDVFIARKLGAPGNPEFGIGAIAEGGSVVLSEESVRSLNLPKKEMQRIKEKEQEELQRRIQLYRQGRPLPDVHNRVVILVDDGLATGVTAQAALLALTGLTPEKLIFAVPVCARETARALRSKVDRLHCTLTPPALRAIGLYYEDFSQTTDEEVLSLLHRAQKEQETYYGRH